MTRKVVHDHDVAGPPVGDEDLLDIDVEGVGVDRPVQDEGRDHAAGAQALRLVRERASEWDVKERRVGMIGFSAGAFLAADIAMEPGGAPLAFVAPIYGGDAGGRPVPANAPPLFIAVAADDNLLFSVARGLFEDWTHAGRSAEFHAYARGDHGFGTARQGFPSDGWLDVFARWLEDQRLS